MAIKIDSNKTKSVNTSLSSLATNVSNLSNYFTNAPSALSTLNSKVTSSLSNLSTNINEVNMVLGKYVLEISNEDSKKNIEMDNIKLSKLIDSETIFPLSIISKNKNKVSGFKQSVIDTNLEKQRERQKKVNEIINSDEGETLLQEELKNNPLFINELTDNQAIALSDLIYYDYYGYYSDEEKSNVCVLFLERMLSSPQTANALAETWGIDAIYAIRRYMGYEAINKLDVDTLIAIANSIDEEDLHSFYLYITDENLKETVMKATKERYDSYIKQKDQAVLEAMDVLSGRGLPKEYYESLDEDDLKSINEEYGGILNYYISDLPYDVKKELFYIDSREKLKMVKNLISEDQIDIAENYINIDSSILKMLDDETFEQFYNLGLISDWQYEAKKAIESAYSKLLEGNHDLTDEEIDAIKLLSGEQIIKIVDTVNPHKVASWHDLLDQIFDDDILLKNSTEFWKELSADEFAFIIDHFNWMIDNEMYVNNDKSRYTKIFSELDSSILVDLRNKNLIDDDIYYNSIKPRIEKAIKVLSSEEELPYGFNSIIDFFDKEVYSQGIIKDFDDNQLLELLENAETYYLYSWTDLYKRIFSSEELFEKAVPFFKRIDHSSLEWVSTCEWGALNYISLDDYSDEEYIKMLNVFRDNPELMIMTSSKPFVDRMSTIDYKTYSNNKELFGSLSEINQKYNLLFIPKEEGIYKVKVIVNGEEYTFVCDGNYDISKQFENKTIESAFILSSEKISSDNFVKEVDQDYSDEKYLVTYKCDGTEKTIVISAHNGMVNLASYAEDNNLIGIEIIKTEKLTEYVSEESSYFGDNPSFDSVYNSNEYGGLQGLGDEIVSAYYAGEEMSYIEREKAKAHIDIMKRYYPDANEEQITVISGHPSCALIAAANIFVNYMANEPNGEKIFKERFGYDLKIVDPVTGETSYNYEAVSLDIMLSRNERALDVHQEEKLTIDEMMQRAEGGFYTIGWGDDWETIGDWFFSKYGIETTSKCEGLSKEDEKTRKADAYYDLVLSHKDDYMIMINANYTIESTVNPENNIENLSCHATALTEIDENGDIIVASWKERYKYVPTPDDNPSLWSIHFNIK